MSKFNTFQSGCRTDSTPRFFALLIISILLTFSCKKECVDICSDYGLTLDKENCNCVCSNGLTAFEFNGYTYCIEESETHDIYILENYNPSAWILNHAPICNPPQLFLSRIPKRLDSLESFHTLWDEEAPFWIDFEFYIQETFRLPCDPGIGSRWAYVPVERFINHSSPEVFLFGVEGYFSYGFMEKIRYDLFENKWGLGIILFSETMKQMTFHFLGYNHLHDMGDAFSNLTLEEIFDFPYIPTQSAGDPYDPLHIQLTFSKLNFE